MTSDGNSFNDFTENQLIKFRSLVANSFQTINV